MSFSAMSHDSWSVVYDAIFADKNISTLMVLNQTSQSFRGMFAKFMKRRRSIMYEANGQPTWKMEGIVHLSNTVEIWLRNYGESSRLPIHICEFGIDTKTESPGNNVRFNIMDIPYASDPSKSIKVVARIGKYGCYTFFMCGGPITCLKGMSDPRISYDRVPMSVELAVAPKSTLTGDAGSYMGFNWHTVCRVSNGAIGEAYGVIRFLNELKYTLYRLDPEEIWQHDLMVSTKTSKAHTLELVVDMSKTPQLMLRYPLVK